MNDLTGAGADADGNPGLDAFTAQAPDGHDFVLKGSMQGTGTISSKSGPMRGRSFQLLPSERTELGAEPAVEDRSEEDCCVLQGRYRSGQHRGKGHLRKDDGWTDGYIDVPAG